MPRPANPKVRNRLLSAGGQFVHRMGFNATGVQDIVRAADVPKGSFYSYFDSKEAFAAEVLEAHWESVERRYGSVMYDARVEPLSRIEQFFSLLAEDHAAHEFRLGCLIGNLSLELANTSSEVRNTLKRILARWEESIVTCLAEARLRGELPADRDSTEIAAIIVETWEGAILRCKVECNGNACQRFLDVTLKRLLY
jgi:TetR/AcrR family transcriptional repressor of nem operon